MAKKKTTAKKTVATRGGTSKQHAKAGRLGGLAPHVCRGSECTKLRKAAAAKARTKKAAATKAKTGKTKARSLFADMWEMTPRKKKVAAVKKGKIAVAKKGRVLKAAAKKNNRSWGLFEELFEKSSPKKKASARTKAGARKAVATKKVVARKTTARRTAKKTTAKRRRSIFD